MLKRLRNQRGAALIEAAITIPLVLLVSVSIFEFGRAYQTWQVLTNAAREGARIAVLPNPPAGSIEGRVLAYMQAGQLQYAADATIVVNRTAVMPLGAGTSTASLVTVNYPFQFMVLQPVMQLLVS